MRDRLLTAYFPRGVQTVRAVASLRDAGVASDAVSVLPKRVIHLADLGLRVRSRALEGAAVGAATGGVLAAVLGAATAGGALVLPGLGAFLAGPIVAALAAAGAGSALGAVAGLLLGARVVAYEAAYLHDAVHGGGALVAVRCTRQESPHLRGLLEAAGATHVQPLSPRHRA